jgi:hypothetical protein
MERSSFATSSSASEPARKYDASVCCVVNSNNLLANAGGALNFFFFQMRHLIFFGGIRFNRRVKGKIPAGRL